MKNSTLLKTGIVGSIVAAVCCFTPALTLVLGALGLSTLVVHLDVFLLPVLALFLCLTGYALWKKARE